MNAGDIILAIQEFALLLGVFGFFIVYSIFRGRQHLINLIVGLYFALLISLVFPYYDTLLGGEPGPSNTLGTLVIFAAFTIISTILIGRLMPEEYREKKFESFFKKLLLALAGTVLVMVFSFHVLPLTELLHPSTPIQSLFAPREFFFWWLIAPLIILYFN
jgi:uncharacterized membrane protein YraQ (UPF0718 family)